MHLGELENEQFFLDLWNATAFSRFIATLHARDNTASPPLRNISFHTLFLIYRRNLFLKFLTYYSRYSKRRSTLLLPDESIGKLEIEDGENGEKL